MTIDLAALRALVEAATPLPWVTQNEYGGTRLFDENSDSPVTCVLPESGSWPEDTICEVWGTEHDDTANAALIVAAVNALPALLAEVEALQADALRYRWLAKRLIAADFDYGGGGDGIAAIVFEWPPNARVSADVDASIDAAKEQTP